MYGHAAISILTPILVLVRQILKVESNGLPLVILALEIAIKVVILRPRFSLYLITKAVAGTSNELRL